MTCFHVLERTAANTLQKIFIWISPRKLATKYKKETLVSISTISNIYARQLWLAPVEISLLEIKSIYSGVGSIKLHGNTIWLRSVISKVKRRSAVSVSGFCKPSSRALPAVKKKSITVESRAKWLILKTQVP